MATLYGLPCYLKTSALSSYSSAPFGNKTLVPTNQWPDISQAFVASETEMGMPEFILYINTESPLTRTINQEMANLATAGWLDAATHTVDVQTGALTLELYYWPKAAKVGVRGGV